MIIVAFLDSISLYLHFHLFLQVRSELCFSSSFSENPIFYHAIILPFTDLFMNCIYCLHVYILVEAEIVCLTQVSV